MNKLSAQEAFHSIDEKTMGGLHVIGIRKTVEWIIYQNYADQSKTIEIDIDLNDIFVHFTSVSRKEFVSDFKRVCSLGLIEILHSSNWKHHRVLVHPVAKVLKQKNTGEVNHA